MSEYLALAQRRLSQFRTTAGSDSQLLERNRGTGDCEKSEVSPLLAPADLFTHVVDCEISEKSEISPAQSRQGARAHCDVHNRFLTYTEGLAGLCSWCEPGPYLALAHARRSTELGAS